MIGRLNKDMELGIRIGLVRGAVMVEQMSEAGKNSRFAEKLRNSARHEDMKVNQMISDGRLI